MHGAVSGSFSHSRNRLIRGSVIMFNNRSSKNTKSGFTLIELLVVVAIIGILASILFPVFSRARESARRSACLSNMKQIGMGMLQYLQDYDETYPRHAANTFYFNSVTVRDPDTNFYAATNSNTGSLSGAVATSGPMTG